MCTFSYYIQSIETGIEAETKLRSKSCFSKLDFNLPALLLRNHTGFSWSYQTCPGLWLDFLGPIKLADYRFCSSGRFASHCQSVRVFGNQEVKINAWKSRVTGRFVPGLSSLYWDRIIVRFDSCFKRLYYMYIFILHGTYTFSYCLLHIHIFYILHITYYILHITNVKHITFSRLGRSHSTETVAR